VDETEVGDDKLSIIINPLGISYLVY